jgi:hypothetical protein
MATARKPSRTRVEVAIERAERILPGWPAPEGERDPRWQAIIKVGECIESHPLEVWRFAREWGAHANEDLRMAVATCLVEHLLEYDFDQIIPLVEQACGQSKRFADTVSSCWEFGQTKTPKNQKRFRRLLQQIRRQRASKP